MMFFVKIKFMGIILYSCLNFGEVCNQAKVSECAGLAYADKFVLIIH